MGHIRSLPFHDYDQAIELFDRALAANPSSAVAWGAAASPSATSARRARRGAWPTSGFGSPYDNHAFFSYGAVGVASYAAGDRDDAVLWNRRSISAGPALRRQPALPRREPAASGRRKEAPAVADALPALNPTFHARAFAERHAFKDPEQRRQFGKHLVMAGLPE